MGIPKKFQEHDILTVSLFPVNNQDLIHTAGSIKVALGIGIEEEEAIVWWSLREIIALFGMPKCPIANCQFPLLKASFIQSAICSVASVEATITGYK